MALLVGLREPVVPVLLLTAFFTGIAGRPVNGVLLALAACFLAWDAGLRRGGLRAPSAGAAPWLTGTTPRGVTALVVVGIAVYGWVVGAFLRYSWPATVGVVGLGMIVVAVGWRGPLRRRSPGQPLPRVGTLAWGVLLLFGGVWELVALFSQPNLATTSFAHPTISALSDPLLTTHPGRSVALLVWLAIGWFLVER